LPTTLLPRHGVDYAGRHKARPDLALLPESVIFAARFPGISVPDVILQGCRE
jgi:hypothetical protein